MSEAKPQILGLVGSPRRGLNTATLVEQALAGAAEAGAATELVYLHECSLEPCDACNGCRDSGICVKGDGMRPLYGRLEASRGLVLGTPIYFDHVSAHGEEVPSDGLFVMTGEELEYPGDGRGSAGNIVNCRCTMTAVLK